MTLAEITKGVKLTDWLLTAFNLLLVGINIYVIIVLGKQLDVMRKDERAWISTQVLNSQNDVGKPIAVLSNFLNTGKTPAKHFKVKMKVEVLDSSTEPTFDFSNELLNNTVDDALVLPHPPPVPTGVTVLRQVPGTQTVEEVTLTQDMHDKYIAGQLWFAFEGKLSYEDVFGVGHWTNFCYANFYRGGPTGPPGIIRPPAVTKKCEEYNDTDGK
jgi:hypothetical protein